jgi:putative FmdB family regulatory protein
VLIGWQRPHSNTEDAVPTYEYRCKACGHELEIVQAFSDDALTRCEACGADELRKVFGTVGISFKGSGFYKNDSRGKTSSTVSAGSDKSSGASGSDSGSSSSTDSSSSSTSTAAASTSA